ncbi:hypothetical protein DLREEDagrD3_15370 [Denitratisoma sp. agr-D3]
MKRLPRPFIALLAALLLVLAQQAALAHMIGHTGAAAQSAIQQNEDGHGAALSLSHACTTCIAFSALDSFAASPTWQLPAAGAAHVRTPAIAVARSSAGIVTLRARAPPLPL